MQAPIYITVTKSVKIYLTYLKSKIRIILWVALIGALLGLFYSILKPIKYTARTSFVVEDSKSSLGTSGIMGALSGQFGSDIMGALGGGSNLLSGENIIELAKSRSLLRKTFLTAYQETDTNNKTSLADSYALSLKLIFKWEKSYKVGKTISFPFDKKTFTRVEDSLLNTLIDRVIKKDLEIYKPDRRLSLFELNITMLDERVANLFCQRLLAKTSELFINAKTKRMRGNISRLQHLADSLKLYANTRIKSAAASNFKLLDINPQYLDQNVETTINSREEILSGTIYSEVLKNLELSKATLLQETPTIQIVDNPDTPLPDNKIEWYEGLIVGLLSGLFISLFLLIFFYEPTIDN